MKLLVDTHAFLWFVNGDSRLSARALGAMTSGEEWALSAASVWEMAIKAGLGRLTLPAPVSEYMSAKVRQGLRIVPIDWRPAAAVQTLPLHHHDPFDRLIVAQALDRRVPVVTVDPVFASYGVKVIW